jgi:hypothetical protein
MGVARHQNIWALAKLTAPKEVKTLGRGRFVPKVKKTSELDIFLNQSTTKKIPKTVRDKKVENHSTITP